MSHKIYGCEHLKHYKIYLFSAQTRQAIIMTKHWQAVKRGKETNITLGLEKNGRKKFVLIWKSEVKSETWRPEDKV